MLIEKFGYNNKAILNKLSKTNNINHKTSLERIPKTDSISFRKNSSNIDSTKISCREADNLKYDIECTKPSVVRGNYSISGEEIELEIKNKLTSGRDIVGQAYGKDINLNISSGVFGVYSGKITGSIGDKKLELKYGSQQGIKNIEIFGDITNIEPNMMTLMILLIKDKIKFDIKTEEAMMFIAMSST